MKLQLLSADSTNAKLAKNADFSPIKSYILYMAPATSNGLGVDLCPAASAGCMAACLNTAGRGAFSNVQAFYRQAFQGDKVRDPDGNLRRTRVTSGLAYCTDWVKSINDGQWTSNIDAVFPGWTFAD